MRWGFIHRLVREAKWFNGAIEVGACADGWTLREEAVTILRLAGREVDREYAE